MTFFLSIFTWFSVLYRQLYLSASTVQFYKDVYKNYTGYGVKYLFSVSFIPAIIYAVFVLNYIATLENYFTKGEVSPKVDNIEYVINQFPEIQYDGRKFVSGEEGIIFLYTRKKNKVIAIDLNDQLTYKEKVKIPVILNSERLIVNLQDFTQTTIEYTKIFNSTPQILTAESVKQYCAYFVKKAPSIFIYIGMPFIIFVWFWVVLFERGLIILLVYIVTNLFGPKSSVQQCIRLVLFSSGVPVITQPILLLFTPQLGNIAVLIQIFTITLLFRALSQIKRKIL